MPLYFNEVKSRRPVEILAHRIILVGGVS